MSLLAAKLTPEAITTEQRAAVVQTVVNRICKAHKPLRIFWFGSSQKNQMRGTSDFDFAIIYENANELKSAKHKVLRQCLFPDIPVDFLFFTEEYFKRKSKIGGVCMQVAEEGQMVYDQRAKV